MIKKINTLLGSNTEKRMSPHRCDHPKADQRQAETAENGNFSSQARVFNRLPTFGDAGAPGKRWVP